MSALHLRSDASDEAKALVLEHHYSHRWPRRTIFVATWHASGGLFGDRGPAVAACVFGCPAATWKEPPLELQRLVRLPEIDTSLTSLIASAAAEVRRIYGPKKINELLISYADPSHGHHGGIYQAASWAYGGTSSSAGMYRIGDDVIHQRAVSHRYGTRSVSGLRQLLGIPISYEPVSKHLYWRALNRRGKAKAKRLRLKSLPYPKPGKV